MLSEGVQRVRVQQEAVAHCLVFLLLLTYRLCSVPVLIALLCFTVQTVKPLVTLGKLFFHLLLATIRLSLQGYRVTLSSIPISPHFVFTIHYKNSNPSLHDHRQEPLACFSLSIFPTSATKLGIVFASACTSPGRAVCSLPAWEP
jgi:hypothetical protein